MPPAPAPSVPVPRRRTGPKNRVTGVLEQCDSAVHTAVRRPQPRPAPTVTTRTKGPAAHGCVEDQRWILSRVATVIARRFHVRFRPAQTWRILHRMGFMVQFPVRRRRRARRRGGGHLAQGDLAERGRTVRDQDAWLCLADESGQVLRPPTARTWSRRGHTARVTVRAGGSVCISRAGLVRSGPGRRTGTDRPARSSDLARSRP
ncbi:winged helix-turn-helix domain-containing protein [Streptomyces sp. NPDC001851]|uniref:winged helix-turn-helix domain-containing protein n=1 Tax=Streptomyces sp. NPDC001851 TaxID=3154529 RepID=UPI003321B1FB